MEENDAQDFSQQKVLTTLPDYQSKIRAMISHDFGQDCDPYVAILEAVKYLANRRMSPQSRVDILNDSGLLQETKKWSPLSLTRYAHREGIRLLPTNDALFSKLQTQIKEEHQFLEGVLEQVREGRTSYSQIRHGLHLKYGGELSGDPRKVIRVPREGIIARVIKFCRNDSLELEKKIGEAFETGTELSAPLRSRPVATYIRHMKIASGRKTLEAE